MVKGRGIAAAGLYVMALTSAAANAQTQDQGTVGNPQLKNFELPGTTTVPPPAQPPVATTPPATSPPTPPAADPSAPQATPSAPAEPAPAGRAPQRPVATPRRQAPPPAPAPAPAARALPTPTELQEALPAPVAPPVQAPQALPLPPPPAAEAPASEERGPGFPWHYLIIAALFGLLAFAGYRKFSRAGTGYEEPAAEAEPMPMPAPEPMPAPQPQPQPAPQPAPAAPASDIVGIQLRPWLEVEFRPARAAATLTDASVQFELIIRNRGNAPARNIRIESGIFNAGPDQEREIAAWYSEPVRERTPPSIAVMAPGEEVQIRSAVSIAKENLREIEVQGRKLFIPTVAFNLIYDWGANKSGQTSVSYVVGREAETPSQKMGPFRLDLGPRLYRSVGQRQTKVAVKV